MNIGQSIQGPIFRGNTTDLHPLSILYIYSIKYRYLYSIMLQSGASVAEGCSALNQHWMFDMNSRTFEMLHFYIVPAVVA